MIAASAVLLGAGVLGAARFESHEVKPALPLTAAQQRFRELSRSWPTEPTYALTFDARYPSSPSLTSMRAAFDPSDDYSGLPRTGAYELVDAYCSGCHSLQIVMQQRASHARWAALITWMTETQNMPPLEEDEAAVLTYLAEHFSAN
ncbi:MAG: hypothetical protein AAF337_04575 [Pseudomonadota bacterium]